MHTCNPTLVPVWYCIFEKVSKQSRFIDKILVNTKYTDNTDAPEMATNLDKVESDDRDDFIAKLNAKGVIYNVEDVEQ